MSKCAVCGRVEKPGDYSRVWVYLGKRAYCEEHVPTRKTLRRKVRELRGEQFVYDAKTKTFRRGPREEPTLGNATSTGRGPRLPKTAAAAPRDRTLPKTARVDGRDREPEVLASFATLRLELVKCGKPGCRKLHGPYWYGYWRTGARVQKKYIGKHLPPSIASKRLAPRRRKRGSAMDARVLEELELGGDDE